MYKPNYGHLTVFMIIMVSAATCQNYALACGNQLTQTFNLKYNWTTQAQQTYHQTLIASSNILGITFGSVSAAKIIVHGRRRALFLCMFIGTVGVCISLIQSYRMCILGRVIQGVASGI